MLIREMGVRETRKTFRSLSSLDLAILQNMCTWKKIHIFQVQNVLFFSQIPPMYSLMFLEHISPHYINHMAKTISTLDV